MNSHTFERCVSQKDDFSKISAGEGIGELAVTPRRGMMGDVKSFEERDRECADLIRGLTSSFDRLGQAYAERHDIHQTDFRALLLVESRRDDEDAMTAGELATALGLSSGAVTYLVERLTSAGLVRRTVDPSDRRKVRLVATQRGKDLVDGHSLPVCEAIALALGDMDDAMLGRMHALLTQVTAGLDEQTARLLADPLVRTAV